MTAVEWLLEELDNKDWYYLPQSIRNEIIEQAKEIEKQQMRKCASFWRGKETEIEKPIFEQYYIETFKNK